MIPLVWYDWLRLSVSAFWIGIITRVLIADWDRTEPLWKILVLDRAGTVHETAYLVVLWGLSLYWIDRREGRRRPPKIYLIRRATPTGQRTGKNEVP